MIRIVVQAVRCGTVPVSANRSERPSISSGKAAREDAGGRMQRNKQADKLVDVRRTAWLKILPSATPCL